MVAMVRNPWIYMINAVMGKVEVGLTRSRKYKKVKRKKLSGRARQVAGACLQRMTRRHGA
jgi:hypothetical protein